MRHDSNPGNNLVKFSINIKLKELGFDPIIIGTSKIKNIYFLKNHVKLKVINKNFNELNENDYDILMVNSDQTWNGRMNYDNTLLNVGFLKFANKWTISRFVYGASLGVNFWKFSHKFDRIARSLIKKFSGVSVREIGAIEIVKKHLGIRPELVLDPTLLIDKKYYLDLIKDFNINFNFKEKYLCLYQLDKNILIEKLVRDASKLFKYKIYKTNLHSERYVENFIFCINNSNAVITDSFHGTIFSIIFKKPFITFLNKKRGNDRFFSLIKIFNLSQRIVSQKILKKLILIY